MVAGPHKVAYADTEYGRIAGVICADAGYPLYMQQVGTILSIWRELPCRTN